MAKRRLLFSNYHAIEEQQKVELFDSLGFDVVSLGAYLVPREPGDPKRPPLDIDPPPAEVLEACRDTHAAKQALPDVVFEWLGDDGVIVWCHFLPQLFAQWPRVTQWMKRGGRVIWRSDGQSSPDLERTAQYYRAQGLERVAYSPRESNWPYYAGHDAVIRFGMDPDELTGWTGETEHVINVTQHLMQRGDATNYWFWERATANVPRLAIGPGSEAIGGTGEVGYDEMKAHLRKARAYLYTGTQSAAYTLGFLEAGLTGVPIVSIGRTWFTWAPEQFEVPDLVPLGGHDDPAHANEVLRWLLADPAFARQIGHEQRERLIPEFGIDAVREQWRKYLS